jgi:LmbE family N-acetylglucosaminyl deacetylase
MRTVLFFGPLSAFVRRRLASLAGLLIVSTLLAGADLHSQLRVQPVGEHPDEATLRLVLRKLKTVGTLMQTDAHPDDEDNALLAMAAHGLGMRAVVVSATRGEGGQNEIGPELFDALGVLRTEELLAVHRFDGAEQLFTRAVDFGYSFSVEESIAKWGRDEIVGDYVRHIRAIRPHVVVGFVCGGDGGGQHHQASTVLTLDAIAAAADPKRYPEQIEQGLEPWRVPRTFCTEGFGMKGPLAADLLTVTDTGFDPLLGRTYGELGIEARSMHKCQGTSQLLPLPGQSFARTYRLKYDATGRTGGLTSLFDGIDVAFHAPGVMPHVTAAEDALDRSGAAAAAPHLLAGLRAVRERLRTSSGDEKFRLGQKYEQFKAALLASLGVKFEALADDGNVVAGQPLRITTIVASRGSLPMSQYDVSVTGLEDISSTCNAPKPPEPVICETRGRVAAMPLSAPYWKSRRDAARYEFPAVGVAFGAPFDRTPFRAVFDLSIDGEMLTVDRPIEFRYDNVVAGEKRMELQVVPPFGVTLAPSIAVVPRGAAAVSRSVRATVINHAKGPATTTVALQAPAGWRVEPQATPVTFAREDEAITVTFDVAPPARVSPGEYTLSVRDGVGYQVVEYPHIHRRHIVRPAETTVRVVDVVTAPDLRVGYIMGVGDQVPEAIRQLGVQLDPIGPDELAAGDLSKYDAIVTGVRAYERRADLRANNHRLIAYAERGGTVLVQYNKFEFNDAQYGPYPAKVSAGRITDENAPVEVLVPSHPVFNRPNRIDASAWSGWVQERGLYFLGERDPRYVDLVRMTDPFPLNPGAKTGALVEAKVGQGRWIYVGLALWRQLPAGTDGAYKLMANLLSLGRSR